MADSHYRTLSLTGLGDSATSRPPFDSGPSRRSSVSYSKRTSACHQSQAGLLHDDVALLVRSSLPRNYRRLRLSAYVGWAVAALLLLSLVASHTSGFEDSQQWRFNELVRTSSWRHRVSAGRADVGPARTAGSAKPTGGSSSHVKQVGVNLGGSHPVTIVSSFYRVDNGKKHRVSEYHEWLGNFLHSVELPIVFYCAPSFAAYVKNLRGNKPITIITDYSSPFDMPPVQDLGGHDWAAQQHKIDPEQHVHVPEVYGVWTAKPWIVKDATRRNPYDSEYFFWVDAGGFRDSAVIHSFSQLPNVLANLYSTVPSDTIMLAATLGPFERGTAWVKDVKRNDEMDRTDRLQGGWFGGKKEAIKMWERETRKVTVLQSALSRFAAKEQPIWTMAARLNWQKIYVQNMAYRSGPDCGPDMWFAFEYFADGRDCEIPAWSGPEYARLEEQEQEAARAAQHMEGGIVGGGDEVGWEGLNPR